MESRCLVLRIVLMGPPGAGKGTQAVSISRHYGVPHISTGDMFRAAIASGREVGARARAYMEQGKLVPDDVTMGIVRERLAESDASRGFVFDGFPRTLPQARELDAILGELGHKLDAVVLIEVPEEELVRRAVGRRVCAACNRLWHTEFNPPPAGVCSCGATLAVRPDDCAETVTARLAVYRNQTEPLSDYYGVAGVLKAVDGSATPAEVEARIFRALGECGG